LIIDVSSNAIPCYWKNGTYNALSCPLAISLLGGQAFGVAATASDVYIAGGRSNSILFGMPNPPLGNQVAAPTFSPDAGTYASAQSVTLSCATSGATIYYTTDGSVPTASSAVYGAPILVASSEKIRAFAAMSGMDDSAVVSATYIIGQVPPCSWDNGVLSELPLPSSAIGGSAWGVVVSGSTVYHTGYQGSSSGGNFPCYWENGVYHDLPLPESATGGQAIWCAVGE
jgi:hypothetical protein